MDDVYEQQLSYFGLRGWMDGWMDGWMELSRGMLWINVTRKRKHGIGGCLDQL